MNGLVSANIVKKSNQHQLVAEKSLKNWEICLMEYRRNTIFIKSVADKFREIRKAKGLSQESVFIDTDHNIGRIESGKKNISISTLLDLCKYYEISLVDFLQDIKTE